MYLISKKQLFWALCVASTLFAVVNSILVIAWFEYKEFNDTPVVNVTTDGRCVKVVNMRNGDGYQCQDVDTVLRRYKVTLVTMPLGYPGSVEAPKLEQKSETKPEIKSDPKQPKQDRKKP